MHEIKSKDNSRLKFLKKLQHKKSFREENNLTVLEGLHLFESYLKNKKDFEWICCTEDFYKKNHTIFKKSWDNKIFVTTETIFKTISELKTNQGFIAVTKIPSYHFDVKNLKEGLYLFIDGIQDPGNLGTIIRTAQAAGNMGIFLSSDCTDPWAPKTLRGSQGCQFEIPIFLNSKLIDLSELSFDIVLADMQGMSVYDFQFSRKTILVLGNEGLGLSKHINSRKYKTISIPMRASVESLNVAITAGIMSYMYNAQFKI
ncbi:MAG: TrmH family RNA methyltransferase [Methylophilaceae bacterium]|jgi:TrmH family RNA methyltransferase